MQLLKAPFGFALLFAVLSCPAQQAAPRNPSPNAKPDAIAIPEDRGSSALLESLRKLQTRASIIVIVAHPDDEDGSMMSYESRGLGTRVTLLTLNRGEGGQNIMSDDFYDALGEVRTQELLQADRYYGVQQYFTRVADYGFSKTKEEALEKWGYDRVLYDVVRIVRMTRPLVVTSTFVGGPTDGHGQHQVSGMMAQQVFDAAADPNVFPDQIKAGLLPWKPLKVYSRVPFFAATQQGMYDYATGRYVPVRFYDYVHKSWIEGPLSDDLDVPTGSYDPALGLNYVQIARTGLGFQKSQNGGTGPAPAGAVTSRYHRFGSAFPVEGKEKSFFDGIDTSISGIAQLAGGGGNDFLKQGLAPINSSVEDALSKFSMTHPEQVAPSLARGLKATRALIAEVEQSSLSPAAKYNVEHELRVKETQFNDALAQALGINVLATVTPEQEPTGRFAMFGGSADTFQAAIPGQEFWVKISATNQSPAQVTVSKVFLATPEPGWAVQPLGESPTTLADNKNVAQRFQVRVPKDAKLTRPYFTRPNSEQPYYDIHVPADLGLPTSDYPLTAELDLDYQGEPIRVRQTVQTVRKVTGPGVELQPLLVAPAISVSVSPRHGIMPLSGTTFKLTVSLRSSVKGEAKGVLTLAMPAGWRAKPAQVNFSIGRDGEVQQSSFEITPGKLEAKPYEIKAIAEYDGEKYTEGFHLTGYEGLRPYPLYSPSTLDTRGVNVKAAPGLKVGYVIGTGDEVPASLEDIGVHVNFLSASDLASGDLNQYDCIVLGVRAYAARPDLITYNGRLLNYVKNGGVLFVQYNSAQYDHNYGPYPYSLTNDPEKVVDETAKVNILDPANPLITWPNKITSADFDGWLEERGHSFMKSWDPRYEALTEVHDPGQDSQKGGLLYARYGKGAYIYGAFALYRQLPEGVPGAFRIIANILSLGKNPGFQAANSSAKQ